MATDLFVSEYDNAASIPSLSLSLSLFRFSWPKMALRHFESTIKERQNAKR